MNRLTKDLEPRYVHPPKQSYGGPAVFYDLRAVDQAWKRLVSVSGDPFLSAQWERIVFLHFAIDERLLRPLVRPPFVLDLFEGQACVSLAAVSMSRFRPCRLVSPAWLFSILRRQRFFNLRTYVHYGDEPGVLFLHGWLSRPLGLALPSGLARLGYAFASLNYKHHPENGLVRGAVSASARTERFIYKAEFPANPSLQPCLRGSISEFAMERCTGFFWRGRVPHVFRVWHPVWSQAPLTPTITDASLITNRFSWFEGARLVEANYADGFDRVLIGRAHRLDCTGNATSTRRHRHSAFFEMP